MRERILEELKNYDGKPLRLMEVCGSHTAAIARYGIKDMISPEIRLISGPGCPVCVTASSYIDRLISLAEEKNVIVTFGDLMRVPGSSGSLGEARGRGADVRMVYSPLDLIGMAQSEPQKTFVFAAVGFETTIPVYAVLLEELEDRGIGNVRLLTALKHMVPVMDRLLSDGCEVDGFLAPGHVSVITGEEEFCETAEKYEKPFAVTGFTADEILLGILGLVRMAERKEAAVRNFYTSVVTREGNTRAKKKTGRFFERGDAYWRGIGSIPASGSYLKKEYEKYDAGSFGLTRDEKYDSLCCCDRILTGRMEPCDCPLFGKKCTPLSPRGACMVSSEGNCFSEYGRAGA